MNKNPFISKELRIKKSIESFGKCEDLRMFYDGLSEIYSNNGETEKA